MLPLLSFTGGLAFLCGLNLYLATLVAGMAVRQGWAGATLHPALEVLGHPVLMTVALILFLIEFVVDKIPWSDSLWDAVHTLIRPLGAVGLSFALSQAASLHPTVTVLVALAAGGIALCSHLTKSGVRLLINASPEPFTNILASIAEDVVVVVLLLLLVKAPVTGFAVCLVLLAGTWIVFPRLLSLVRTSGFLLWKKSFNTSPAGIHGTALPDALTVAEESLLRTATGPEVLPPAWAVSCVSGKTKVLPGHRANRFGTLVSPRAHPGLLIFLSRSGFRRRAVVVSLAGARVHRETTFLSENLVIHRPDDGMQVVFRFTRAEASLVHWLVDLLQAGLGLSAPMPHPLSLLPPLPAPQSGEGRMGGTTPPPFPH